jgi:AraC family transcriptional regulator
VTLMAILPSDQKDLPGNILTCSAMWTGLHVEHRHIGRGLHHCDPQADTELAYILSGRSGLRRQLNGKVQEGMALTGTSWLAPAGTEPSVLEFEGETECLMIHLPPSLLGDTALADYDIDPARAGLVYAGGFADPTLSQITLAIGDLLGRQLESIDRLFAEGLRTALAAHLIRNYTVDRWQAQSRRPSLEPRRLQRVLSYVEAKLGESISIEDLAGEACLSPYHFARLFQKAMGRPPHRYVVERRIAAAKEKLRTRHSAMAEVALDTGFGTQANFSRVFRKVTGMTPRQYREMSG